MYGMFETHLTQEQRRSRDVPEREYVTYRSASDASIVTRARRGLGETLVTLGRHVQGTAGNRPTSTGAARGPMVRTSQ